MSTVLDDFVFRAREITVTQAALDAGIAVGRGNYAGPCPVCGGNDRFSINPRMEAWKCRGCDKAGRDGISLAAHINGYDTHGGRGFLLACAAALNEPVPDESARETDEERAERERRAAQRRRQAEEKAAAKAAQDNAYRAREVRQAQGIYNHARPALHSPVAAYLHLRTGFEMAPDVFEHIRIAHQHSYWHGVDERGRATSIYCGPAMIAGLFAPDGSLTGCHETWIDLDSPRSKFRPALGLDGRGNPLPTKKMRGSKRGKIIPCCGLVSASRWVLGEGIETVLAIAGAERFRADTFYAATGDLGNLAGPAARGSSFPHPHALTPKGKPQSVPGPVPKPDQAQDEAVQLHDHVTDVVLLADGDSDPFMTASVLARTEARLSRPGRTINTWWPPAGEDWASAMLKASQRAT